MQSAVPSTLNKWYFLFHNNNDDSFYFMALECELQLTHQCKVQGVRDRQHWVSSQGLDSWQLPIVGNFNSQFPHLSNGDAHMTFIRML